MGRSLQSGRRVIHSAVKLHSPAIQLDDFSLVPYLERTVCEALSRSFEHMRIADILGYIAQVQQAKVSKPISRDIAIQVFEKGLGERAPRPSGVHVLDVPERILIALCQ